jgi:hypothetical protein
MSNSSQGDPNSSQSSAGSSKSDEAILKNYLKTDGDDTSTERFPIPGLEFLGMGYDVFGRYASVDSCKQNIIDFSAANQVEQPTFNRNPDPETLARRLTSFRPKSTIFIQDRTRSPTFRCSRSSQSTNSRGPSASE